MGYNQVRSKNRKGDTHPVKVQEQHYPGFPYLRQEKTYRKRRPRAIKFCGHCGKRMGGLKKALKNDKGAVVATHRCSSCKRAA
jgi:hypothetical protein